MSSIYIISSIIYRNKNIFSNRNWAVAQPTDAQASVAELKREGFEEQDISVLYTDAGHSIQAGMITGAVWGGARSLMGLALPPDWPAGYRGTDSGEFLSGMRLAAAGAVTVAALDGLISALLHLGMPREMATRLGERVHKGDMLVIVHAANPDLAEKARAILRIVRMKDRNE
jgi:hypothetical protein